MAVQTIGLDIGDKHYQMRVGTFTSWLVLKEFGDGHDGLDWSYRLAYVWAKKEKLAVPDSFDAFMELEPELDFSAKSDDDGDEDAEGNGSSST
jgi:hypothetical protein